MIPLPSHPVARAYDRSGAPMPNKGWTDTEAAAIRAYGDARAAEAAETIRQLRSVLRVIVEQDPVENILDPQWAARIAKGGLEATQ